MTGARSSQQAGARGRVREPDATDALTRELEVLAIQVSAAWVGTQVAVDAVRDQRRG